MKTVLCDPQHPSEHTKLDWCLTLNWPPMAGRGERERGEVNREQTKSYIAQDKTLTFNVIGEIPYCLT
jgi:hypothetical protein